MTRAYSPIHVPFLFVPLTAFAAYPDAMTTVGPATFHGCYDGDTCTISIPGLPQIFGEKLSLRLVGIDTPEMQGKCEAERSLAAKAKAFLNHHLHQAQQVELVARDKYFRVLALIIADGLDLADEMVKAGLVMPTREARSKYGVPTTDRDSVCHPVRLWADSICEVLICSQEVKESYYLLRWTQGSLMHGYNSRS
jgi:micrococcal nuclease